MHSHSGIKMSQLMLYREMVRVIIQPMARSL